MVVERRRGSRILASSAGSVPRHGWRLANGRPRAMRALCGSLCLASLVGCLAGSARAAAEYPLVLTLDAVADTAAAAVKASVTINVDRLMEESRRKKVTDALSFGGYGNFLPALRVLPPVGKITLNGRTVSIRYAREQQEETGRRLVLVADRPLFFLGGDPAKARAGYELTIVDLRFDAKGGASGTMAGAARVKPSPDGLVVLDDWAEAPVRLTSRPARP
jgi:hypothetical protein